MGCATPRHRPSPQRADVKDSPARRAGIRPDDLLAGIDVYLEPDGTPFAIPRILRTDDRSVNEVKRMRLGREGTRVEVILFRPGVRKLFTLQTDRRPLKQETVMGWKRRQDDW